VLNANIFWLQFVVDLFLPPDRLFIEELRIGDVSDLNVAIFISRKDEIIVDLQAQYFASVLPTEKLRLLLIKIPLANLTRGERKYQEAVHLTWLGHCDHFCHTILAQVKR